MATESSKIPKRISAIYHPSEKKTVLHYNEQFQPQGQNEVVKEQKIFKSNLGRHEHFNKAMGPFAVHLMCRALDFVKPEDKFGKVIDKDYFDQFLFDNDPRFSEIKVTGVIITTKDDQTGFYILGEYETADGQKVKLKSPVISTLTVEGGYNYPLRELAKDHLETLLIEAGEFIKYKSSNPQLRIAV